MLQHQRKSLAEIGVTMKGENSQIHFGFGRMTEIRMEGGVTLMPGKFDVNQIGAYTYLGGGETIVRNTSSIGRFCSIAPNLMVAPQERPVDFLSTHRFFQNMFVGHMPEAKEYLARHADSLKASQTEYRARHSDEVTKVSIGNDVWIGEGVFIRRGVTIGDGAIIAARSVVNKDVPSYSIYGGIPAKKIRMRFDDYTCDLLKETRWWDYGLPALEGIDFIDAQSAAIKILNNIQRNNLPLWKPASKTVLTNGTVVSEDIIKETCP